MQLKFNDAYNYSMKSLGRPGKQHDNSLKNGLSKACVSGVDIFFLWGFIYSVLVTTGYCSARGKAFILADDGNLLPLPVASVRSEHRSLQLLENSKKGSESYEKLLRLSAL